VVEIFNGLTVNQAETWMTFFPANLKGLKIVGHLHYGKNK